MSTLLDCIFIEKFSVFLSAGYLLPRVATLLSNRTGKMSLLYLHSILTVR